MLNERGGIESDLTVTRLSETAFFLVVPGATLQRDLAWLRNIRATSRVVHHRRHAPPRACSA